MDKAEEAGAKHGREMAGQDDFMTVAVEEAGGDVELLDAAMAAAERAAAERYAQDEKEGTTRKRAGRMFVSPGKGKLCMTCMVPVEHHEKATAEAWMRAVLDATGGRMLEADPAHAKALCEAESGSAFTTPSGKAFSQAEALGFEATAASVAWLRGLGLFPAKEEEDDDDFIPEW